MTIAITATAQPSTNPPSVLLNLTRTGSSETTVRVRRIDADGVTRDVRTIAAGPVDISTGTATVTDYEYPYGTSVTYLVQETGSTASFSMDVAQVWLTHIGVPSRSVAVRFRPGSFGVEEWGIEEGVFSVLERSTPIVVTGGSRQEGTGSFTIAVSTPGELTALKDLFRDGSALLLNASPSLGWHIETAYIAAGSIRRARTVASLFEPDRDLEVPYRVVSRPEGGTRAAYTWADEAADYATWSAIPAGTKWSQVAAGS